MNGAGFVASRKHAATDAEMLFSTLVEISAANDAQSRLPQAGGCAQMPTAAAGRAFAPRRTPGAAPNPIHVKKPAVRPAWDATTALGGDQHFLQVPVRQHNHDMRPHRRIGPPTTGVAFGAGISQTPAAGGGGFAAALAAASGGVQPHLQDSARLDAAASVRTDAAGFGRQGAAPEWRQAPRKRPSSASAQMRSGQLASANGSGVRMVRAAKQAPPIGGVFGTAAKLSSTVPVYHIR
jgi:hypothetical protein